MKRIQLTQGLSTIVDDEDYDDLIQFRWRVSKDSRIFYAIRNLPRSENHRPVEAMHRRILGLHPNDGRSVDHIDRNSLNNRRANLRLVTQQQNCFNQSKREGTTSKFRGVSKQREKWQAQCGVNGKQYYLGLYATEEDAARIYNHFASVCFGPHAALNEGIGDRAYIG